MFDVLRIQSLPSLLLVNRLGEPMFLPCARLLSYLSYSTNMKKFSKIISWHKTRGIFYMEYAISKRSEESNKEGNDWASVLKPQWSDGRESLVENDSCISGFVCFSCSFSLYNRTFAFSVFPRGRSSINGKRKHHRKV